MKPERGKEERKLPFLATPACRFGVSLQSRLSPQSPLLSRSTAADVRSFRPSPSAADVGPRLLLPMLGVLTFTAYKATLIEFLHFPLATAFLCGEIAWGAALLSCGRGAGLPGCDRRACRSHM